MAAAEALTAGCHAVVSATSGIAQSVQDMKGTFVVSPASDSIALGLDASRGMWRGRIASPEILRHSPYEFACTVVSAVELAIRRCQDNK